MPLSAGEGQGLQEGAGTAGSGVPRAWLENYMPPGLWARRQGASLGCRSGLLLGGSHCPGLTLGSAARSLADQGNVCLVNIYMDG